jgi:hypothetical protein
MVKEIATAVIATVVGALLAQYLLNNNRTVRRLVGGI